MAADRTIFITGFPGFIAERLVERLAVDASTDFYLLTLPSFAAASEEAANGIAQRTGMDAGRFRIVEGDITKPGLGILPEIREAIRRETTDVFHLAAVYDLAVARGVAFDVNVGGTRNVNEFLRPMPSLRRYNYVSTCYVAGRRQGHILETELEHDAGFRNHYEASKYAAEVEVERLKADLPLTIFRPAVVVGDSKTGETAKYDGIYYLIRYLLRAPSLLRLVNVGNPNVRLNLVPVDFVVDGMAALSTDPEAVGSTVALADPSPLATSELFDSIASELTGRKSIVTPPASLTEWALMLPFTPSISGLPHAGVPYFFLEQTYDTRIASALLAKHAITCPGFRDYVGDLLEFVKMHPKL